MHGHTIRHNARSYNVTMHGHTIRHNTRSYNPSQCTVIQSVTMHGHTMSQCTVIQSVTMHGHTICHNARSYNPKMHYLYFIKPQALPKCRSLVHILSRMNPVYTGPCNRTNVNSIPPSISRSSKWRAFTSSQQNPIRVSHVYHECYMPHTSHSPRF
jgi:hypothetical protein